MLGTEGLLAADFQIRDGKLFCFRKESLEMIRPWGAEAGAWRLRAGTGWQAFAPDLRIERLEEAASSHERIRHLPPHTGYISNSGSRGSLAFEPVNCLKKLGLLCVG